MELKYYLTKVSMDLIQLVEPLLCESIKNYFKNKLIYPNHKLFYCSNYFILISIFLL